MEKEIATGGMWKMFFYWCLWLITDTEGEAAAQSVSKIFSSNIIQLLIYIAIEITCLLHNNNYNFDKQSKVYIYGDTSWFLRNSNKFSISKMSLYLIIRVDIFRRSGHGQTEFRCVNIIIPGLFSIYWPLFMVNHTKLFIWQKKMVHFSLVVKSLWWRNEPASLAPHWINFDEYW